MTTLPDNSLPPADVPARWRGWQNTPGWVSGLALTLVVVCVIIRTGFMTRDTGSKAETESLERAFAAVSITKTAFAQSRPSEFVKVPGKKKPPPSSERLADDALASWRQITGMPFVHTSDWRRLGLTLSLFHRPGVAEAFSHIAAARAVDAARLAKEKGQSARSRKAQAAEVPVGQEVALWKSLYGPKPITPDQVERLRTVIGRLNLGWFEHAALAQLYTRAEQTPQAAAELDAAYRSAALLVGYNDFEGWLLMLGGVGLLTSGLMFLLNRISTAESASVEMERAPADYARVPPPPALPLEEPLPLALLPMDRPPVPTPLHFSYRARTVAFSVYMSVFMIIGLPLRILLASRWFHPLFDNWSAGALGRFNTVAEIVLYLPVVFIALWTLRHVAAAERSTRALPTWRETFQALGMTSQRPLADIGVGAMNYVMLLPVFYAVTAFSQKIFERFHTPINPVQFDSMMAQNNVDRLLLLLVTAVAAPIVEELMFRGLLYPALRDKWGKIGGAAFSAAIFAIVHPTIPGGFLPIMLLGFAFALTYERRGSLLPNIVMHGIHNALILLTVFFIFSR